MATYNPYDKWKLGWTTPIPSAQSENPGSNLTPGNFADPGSDADITKASLTRSKGALVELPPHLFIPNNAQSIDITKVCNTLAGTIRETLMSFTAPDGGMTVFLSYGVFTDAEFADTIEFRPEVNGTRIFPYHGDPDDDFKIKIGTGPDLSNNALKTGYIILQPDDLLEWKVSNTGAITTVMGVRSVGYFISSQQLEATRVGG